VTERESPMQVRGLTGYAPRVTLSCSFLPHERSRDLTAGSWARFVLEPPNNRLTD
jgi:hypothetical protein